MTFSDATSGASFTTFSSLCKRAAFVTQENLVYSVTLKGQNARRDYEKLQAIAIPLNRLLDGQAIENENGDRLARVRGTAYLVNITSTEFNTDDVDNSESFSQAGVITSLQHNVQSGFNSQECTFAFHVCSKIHANAQGTLTTLEAV